MTAHFRQPSFSELYTPKLIVALRERYGLVEFKADFLAGLTVAIVALPLSMAIAIASGVTPDRGLYTSIFGGFVVSALGGSRFQIGGPAGAFIVLVAAAVEQHGVDGVILATFLAGMILIAVGFLRLGAFIKYIPYPVMVGFTSGIAVIIFASQVKDLLGLNLPSGEPGPILPKARALVAALPTANWGAIAVATSAIIVMVAIRKHRPHWPAYLIAVGLGAVATALLGLPIETIGSRFGGIPQAIPAPRLPALSLEKVAEMLPTAFSFALLSGIESLLSAVVADSMTGRRHRSNGEIVGQGAANIVSALFGGICTTGLIARTATSVRAGARSPIAGILHSIFLLLFMLLAAPLARYIPLATLAAVLAVVAWNMAEKHEFLTLLRASRGDAIVLLATFALVVFRDLTEGILVGFGIGALLFLHRMAQAVKVELPEPANGGDGLDGNGEDAPFVATDPDIVAYRISGAFFFGSAASVAAALERIGEHPKAYIIDFTAVPMIDSTAATTIAGFARKARRRSALVFVTGASAAVRRALLTHGARPPNVRYRSRLAEAFAAARRETDAVPSAPTAARSAVA